MLVAIIGTRSAGKSTVEEYLVANEDFTRLRLYADDDYDGASTHSFMSDETTSIAHEDHHFDKHLSFLSMDSGSTPVPSATLTFESTNAMLDHVTRNWRIKFVTSDLSTRELVEPFTKRPFFMLLNVDAPLLTRFRRSDRKVFLSYPSNSYQTKRPRSSSLEEYVHAHDHLLFGNDSSSANASLAGMRSLVHVSVNNTFSSVPQLHAYLKGLRLTDPVHLRPDWDTYFMTLASLASQRSNCMKRRVGAILVRDNRIVATGYNGTPRHLQNCNEGGCVHCNQTALVKDDTDQCLCLHAEENALLEAGRERVGQGSVLYCNTCPCLKCTVKIIQTGVKAVVYNLSYKVDAASAALFKQAGVELRRHPPPSTAMFNFPIY